MIEIRCPEVLERIPYQYRSYIAIFMAGGITGCPNWQNEIATDPRYKDSKIFLINPRRDSFDCSKAESSQEQINWEYRHLQLSDKVFVWFPKEGACAITLFELGWLVGTNKDIAVGVEPGYARELDVYEQLKLRKPRLQIAKTLDELYSPLLSLSQSEKPWQ